MKNSLKIAFVSAVTLTIALLSPSCKYENEQSFKPSCDSTKVKFSATILPLIVKNCQGSDCHSSNNQIGNRSITTYLEVKDMMTDPANNNLLGVIKHQPGFSRMPKNRVKLDDCTIAKVQHWVDEGALNN